MFEEGLNLLPCPHCGKPATLWAVDMSEGVYVFCDNCGMRGPLTEEMTESAAISAWNALPRRADIERVELEQKSPAKTTAIAFTGLTVRRWNAHPGSGMVADDLGRWVSFEEHNEQLLRLERQLNVLAVLLAQQQGRSVTHWREYARTETKSD